MLPQPAVAVTMYAGGMSVRNIQACLLEVYQVDVSEGLISQATSAMVDEVRAWHLSASTQKGGTRCFGVV